MVPNELHIDLLIGPPTEQLMQPDKTRVNVKDTKEGSPSVCLEAKAGLTLL